MLYEIVWIPFFPHGHIYIYIYLFIFIYIHPALISRMLGPDLRPNFFDLKRSHRCHLRNRRYELPNQCIWSNYSDLTRPHPKWWFSKGYPLISGKSRLVKYYNLTRMYRINRKGWDIRDQTFSSTGADSVTVTHVQMKLYIYIFVGVRVIGFWWRSFWHVCLMKWFSCILLFWSSMLLGTKFIRFSCLHRQKLLYTIKQQPRDNKSYCLDPLVLSLGNAIPSRPNYPSFKIWSTRPNCPYSHGCPQWRHLQWTIESTKN